MVNWCGPLWSAVGVHVMVPPASMVAPAGAVSIFQFAAPGLEVTARYFIGSLPWV